MDNTNLFKHSPKELVTDAFITWLLYFLDSQDNLSKEKTAFFNTLLLKREDRDKKIDSIKVHKQKKGKRGRPDILLKFNLDNLEKTILFENKTWTTTTDKQLNGYREDYGNIYRYFYLKLAYITPTEKLLCNKYGYDIISSEDLLNSLVKVESHHPFIEQYAEYIRNTFTEKINGLTKRIIEKNDFKVLENAQGQQIFVALLYEGLRKQGIENMEFKPGSNYGNPWTLLEICKSVVEYTEGGNKKTKTETIFWRVHKRNGKNYVRLNQYSFNPPKAYLFSMKNRLSIMRSILKDIAADYSQLNQGKLANRKEAAQREIVIFFEDKNSLLDLLEVLPLVSKRFIEEYKNMNNSI